MQSSLFLLYGALPLMLACAESQTQPVVYAPSVNANANSGAPGGNSFSNLNPQNAVRETYVFDELGPKEMLTFEAQHVRLSADCNKNGAFQCDAARCLAKGKQVKIGSDSPAGANPGAVACKKLGFKNASGRKNSGDEDGFCVFPDGSMASTGSLDFYVIE
jgi:putative hemolysin